MPGGVGAGLPSAARSARARGVDGVSAAGGASIRSGGGAVETGAVDALSDVVTAHAGMAQRQTVPTSNSPGSNNAAPQWTPVPLMPLVGRRDGPSAASRIALRRTRSAIERPSVVELMQKRLRIPFYLRWRHSATLPELRDELNCDSQPYGSVVTVGHDFAVELNTAPDIK